MEQAGNQICKRRINPEHHVFSAKCGDGKHICEDAKDSGIYHTRRDGRPSDRFARNMVLEKDGAYVPSDVSKATAPYVIGSDGLNGCDYLYTTLFDMLSWDRALREEKVLTREVQRIMYTPVKALPLRSVSIPPEKMSLAENAAC